MKTRELIEQLSACPQDADVRFFVSWEDRRSVDALTPEDADGDVVLADKDIPAELFARDFQ
jgi:hypothetical protein